MRPFWDSSESKLCVCKLLLIHACICKSLSVLQNYQRILTVDVVKGLWLCLWECGTFLSLPIECHNSHKLSQSFLTNAVVCLHFISSALSRSNTVHTLACIYTDMACIYTCVACICTCMAYVCTFMACASQRTLTMFVGVVALCYQHNTRVVLIMECHNFHKHSQSPLARHAHSCHASAHV